MGFVDGHDAGAVERAEEQLAVDADVLGSVVGNDLAVVGIGLVHQLRVEVERAEVEGNLRLLDGNLDLAFAGERALEFVDRLGREDDVLLAVLGELELALDHGEAAAVGCDEGELFVLEAHQHALEGAASVVLAGGVGDLAEHFAESRLLDGVGVGAVLFREAREVLSRHADEGVLGAAGLDDRPFVEVDFDRDLPFRHLGDGVEEQADGESGLALLLDGAGTDALDGDVEVGGGHLELLAVRFDEDVLEDGEGPLSGHDVLDSLESFDEL